MASQSSEASPDTPSEPSQLRCGINDLPTEIKARIVELCAEQDERFKQWLARRPTLAQDLKKNGMMHGRSVNALFQISKQFSELAAPFLFKVLDASKIDLRFKYSVAPSRLPLFSEIRLQTLTHTSNSQDVLPLLPLLKKARILNLRDTILSEYWGGEVAGLDFAHSQHASALYAALSFRSLDSIVELKVDYVRTHEYLRILPAFATALRTLDITCDVNFYAGTMAGLGAALSATTNLETLQLDCYKNDPSRGFVDLSDIQHNLSATPPLRSLSLTVSLLHSSSLPFIALFSATLETLDVNCITGVEDLPFHPYTPPLFSTEVFPRLSTFRASGDCDVIGDTVVSLEPSHAPALEHLVLTMSDMFEWIESSPLDGFSAFPRLHSLQITNFACLSSLEKATIYGFTSLNSLELKDNDGNIVKMATEQDRDGMSEASSEEDGAHGDLSEASSESGGADEQSLAQIKANRLLRTIAYVGGKAEEAKEQDDAALLDRLTESLKQLALERQAAEAWAGM